MEGLVCADPGARTPIGASGNLLVLVLAIALPATSFSSTGQEDGQDFFQNPVTSMSILVRRIIRTKVDDSGNKKGETSKMKFKRKSMNVPLETRTLLF